MKLTLDTNSIEDYRKFLAIKGLPKYRIRGHEASFPNEYAERIGLAKPKQKKIVYQPHPDAFDYQRDICGRALDKQRFALFCDCGLGKTMIFLDYCRHIARELPAPKAVLIVSPLMVIKQTLDEAARWFNDDLEIEHVDSQQLQDWLLHGKTRIGITNYEAFRHRLNPGRLAALVPDESSLFKSHYGKYGRECIRMGRGIDWKLPGTGTPAPNDRIEYANHAVFLDQFPTVNAFLARFFVNRGQTCERWSLKAHALEPFYRQLSHWSIFLSNPGVYGWKCNCEPLPPIHVHYDHVPLTTEQERLVFGTTGQLIPVKPGGITKRQSWSSISKGWYRGKKVSTNKPAAILRMLDLWPDESTLIWCKYNPEQDALAALLPDAANIDGSTPIPKRLELIEAFRRGEKKVMISKPKILGFGLNLQNVTRQIFSTLQDSYEEFYQAVKRSNRYGSTRPLNVHIPLTDLEEPMVENVMRKARMIQSDTEEQEAIFKRMMT